MARSESFNKKDKEKKRLEHRRNKAEKMQERKANKKDGQSLDDMLAYVDENGNLSSTPPDPKKMREVNVEDIAIGVPKYVEDPADFVRSGTITFFNDAKGFGFIKDAKTGESVFVHINNLKDRVKENDKVSFETERGPRGLSAVNVKKA